MSDQELSEPEAAGPTLAGHADERCFQELRPLLFSVAYRMLGQASDAEDMVQESWLRYARDHAAVRDTRAWLVQVVTRLCLDELRSARHRRETYVGPWLPEPVLTGNAATGDPLATVERHELLSLGALALLERLPASERAVLVLREALAYSHAEIARAVGITEVASRQLLRRARSHLADSPALAPASTPSKQTHQRLVTALRRAFETGDVDELVALMREDVVMVSDGGGEVKAALNVITGRNKFLRLLLAQRRQMPSEQWSFIDAEVNGLPAAVFRSVDGTTYILAMTADADGLLASALAVMAPSKLAFVNRQLR